MAQVRYDVSGTGNFEVWKAMCTNIVAQKDLYVSKLKDTSDITKAVVSAYSNQATSQYNQLEDQKEALIAQGSAGIAAGVTAAAVEIGTLCYSMKLDSEADGKQKGLETQDEIGSANVDEVEPPASVASGSPSSSDPASAGKPVVAGKPDEVVADVSKAPAPVSRGAQADAEEAQAVGADEDAEAVLDARQGNAKTQQGKDQLSGDEARDSVTTKDKEREVQQLRNKATGYRMGGSALATAVSSICTGIGSLVQAYWTDQQAGDQKLATLYQGAETALQAILQQIQAMMQAADTSQQGTLSTLASLIAASVIRG